MKKEKEIPFKNYIVLAVILMITIILTIYLFNWQSAYQKNKLQEPILDKYLMVINYNELDNYLVENKDAVVYISALKNEKIKTFENKLKNTIIKNNLNNKILYLNLTEEPNDLKKIEEKYHEKLLDVPILIVFNDNEIVSSYNIKENNYNIKGVESFLMKEGIISD